MVNSSDDQASDSDDLREHEDESVTDVLNQPRAKRIVHPASPHSAGVAEQSVRLDGEGLTADQTGTAAQHDSGLDNEGLTADQTGDPGTADQHCSGLDNGADRDGVSDADAASPRQLRHRGGDLDQNGAPSTAGIHGSRPDSDSDRDSPSAASDADKGLTSESPSVVYLILKLFLVVETSFFGLTSRSFPQRSEFVFRNICTRFT